MSFVERSIILCPYLGGSTIGGSTVLVIITTTIIPQQSMCLIVATLIPWMLWVEQCKEEDAVRHSPGSHPYRSH